MKKIPLTQGKFALVDDGDFEFLSQWKWHYHIAPKDRTGYALRNSSRSDGGSRKTIRMHRCLLEEKRGFVIDHINRNGLDNRRKNLRHVTAGQSVMNRQLPRSGAHSLYPGVGRTKDSKGVPKYWTARITIDGVRKYLGVFKTAELAYAAWCKSVTEFHAK